MLERFHKSHPSASQAVACRLDALQSSRGSEGPDLIGLLQRVSEASVIVEGETIAAIERRQHAT